MTMDGFTGFKTATREEIPTAVTVMDPFHVIRLAGDALDACRRRVRVDLHGFRGRKNHPPHQARRTLHTGAELLTDKQQHRLDEMFADDQHVEVETTWSVYQTMITAYRTTSRAEDKTAMVKLNDTLGKPIPTALVEVAKLGRTLTKQRDDILTFFHHTDSSNDPTEAINMRLEHLRGTTLGLRNPTHHITRSLLETSGLRPDLHPRIVKSRLRSRSCQRTSEG